MSQAFKISLDAYDSHVAQMQATHPLLLPTRDVWIRAREWTEGKPPRRKFSVGIVGTRKPSEYGLRVTEELVARLARFDVCVVSGGAFGIDRIAHESALTEGLSTKAWLVGPIEDPGPRAHRRLFEAIEKAPGSALLVPSHLNNPENGTRQRLGPWSWLARNAWVAADVDALVVVEAFLKSGTWQTVNDAHELGKAIFLVPGSIFTASSCGTNKMISNSCGQIVLDLGELTETLVVLAHQGSYNINKSPSV